MTWNSVAAGFPASTNGVVSALNRLTQTFQSAPPPGGSEDQLTTKSPSASMATDEKVSLPSRVPGAVLTRNSALVDSTMSSIQSA
jgi:hypothetical protein